MLRNPDTQNGVWIPCFEIPFHLILNYQVCKFSPLILFFFISKKQLRGCFSRNLLFCRNGGIMFHQMHIRQLCEISFLIVFISERQFKGCISQHKILCGSGLLVGLFLNPVISIPVLHAAMCLEQNCHQCMNHR